MLALVVTAPLADSDVGQPSRLQELLAGEVLFHAHQKDYLSAITHLQLAREQGMTSRRPIDSDVLLTRLKLAFGLHEEARLALHAQLSQKAPESVRNRAWYELAKSLFHKGYLEAAMNALDSIQGKVPEDILGDHQLLHAHLLMALHRDGDAATVLETWKGPVALKGYAHYNRGIALVRVEKYQDAIDSLTEVLSLRGKKEESLALKDKANLSLGYAYLRSDNLEQAQAHFKQIRLQSPFSNRALLAMGWIAKEQGRGRDALAPWTELSNRTLADPAVQESMLAVPFVHRELRSFGAAAQHYVEAVIALSQEIHRLDGAVNSLQEAGALNSLLSEQSQSGTGPVSALGSAPNYPASRYLGSLLASRIFLETSRGHSDLLSMSENLEYGLKNIDRLTESVRATPAPKRQLSTVSDFGRSGSKPNGPAPRPRAAGNVTRSAPPSVNTWAADSRSLGGTVPSSRGIPFLPEVGLPPERAVESPPRSGGSSFPQSEVIGFPESEVISLPESEVIWLPKSEWIRRPDTGRFRFPKSDYRDSPYLDAMSRDGSRLKPPRRSTTRYRGSRAALPTAADGEATGKALEDLASNMGHATERMDKVVRGLGPEETRGRGLEHRLAVLRERILRLHDRVATVIVLYEDYARTLAVDELQRRQSHVEHYLEQARLELAKTYDLAAGR